MIKFLLNKPIAVTMTFIAILVLGVVSSFQLPVSLMPNIDVPEITIQVSSENSSARELENSVVRRLRQQLVQVSHLADIHSETSDGSGIIRLNFDYGADIDYAFIEVNEKIDRAMNSLPREMQRPKVIKASASDIPVFYLNLTLKHSRLKGHRGHGEDPEGHGEKGLKTKKTNSKEDSKFQVSSSKLPQGKPETTNLKPETTLYPVSQPFVELSTFASNVIRKRLEQLAEVAMVDMSGLAKTEILIMPDLKKLDALGISLDQLEDLIKLNDIRLGNLSIQDGQYLYNIRFSSTLQNQRDLENIYLKFDDRLLQLKDLAKVIDHPQQLKGMVTSNGVNAITLAVIKQNDARMNEMKASLHHLVKRFEKDYTDIEFEITRDQTQLLDYSMNNLQQSLIWGALLAFIVMFLFLRDFKSPLLIGLTIPLSLVVSLLFFHLIGISINIISLSGLILGVGMMIDNSIIVIDNITQHLQRNQKNKHPFDKNVIARTQDEANPNINQYGDTNRDTSIEYPATSNQHIFSACVSGTNEVIRPMLSSVLTTCAVFIPLIFIKGISGALFYDQAMAVTIGLFSSLAVSITILPVYYLLMFKRGFGLGKNKILHKINGINFENLYEHGFRFTMRNQGFIWILFVAMLAGAFGLSTILPKSKLPVLEKSELLVNIDWNERINIEENRKRTDELMAYIDRYVECNTCLIGEQQFLLDDNASKASEAIIYLKAKNALFLDSIKNALTIYFVKHVINAVFIFEDAGNIFNIVFADNEVPLLARLRATDDFGDFHNQYLKEAHSNIQQEIKHTIAPINWQEHLVFKAYTEKLLLYNIGYNRLYGKLKSLFNENRILMITENNDFLPVVLGGKPKLIEDIISEATIMTSKGDFIPVRELLERETGYDLKTIVAGKEGEFYPVVVPTENKQAEGLMQTIRKTLKPEGHFETSFSGSIFSNKEMIRQLIIILMISMALLYFILASQFESLTLPLIVLLEVPIDLFGAFLFLWLFDAGINLMSLIGIIVMSGIIINDSILKIDTIKQLQNQGYSLMRALSTAGRRRLKPILMTSITTILALVPFLFTKGLGSDLQRPLALAVIGGMLIGTLVSLYFIPLGYYYLKRNTELTEKTQSNTEKILLK
jgi:multidrug efflux pump subunit AcrB